MSITIGDTDIKNIYVGEGMDDYSAMKGPSPDGFHIPTRAEWTYINNALVRLGLGSKGATMLTYLKMPYAGLRNYGTSNTANQGTQGEYWASTGYNTDSGWMMYFTSSSVSASSGGYRSYGHSIRCIKDTPVAPDSTRTALYKVGTKGVYHNSSLGLISISSDGTTRYTIADKNLGATTVYNSGDALSEANCGKYYQRGNNYGFARTGGLTLSSSRVDASNYGPGNYYDSSTFIVRRSSPYDWSSVQNDNLRGGETGVVKKGNVKEVYVGTTKVRPTAVNTPGIYWNGNLGLISLSSDGSTWITIRDRNLGASSNDINYSSSYGNFYQWGNNYGFNYNSSITVNQTKVNVSSYGPNNYYSSSTVYVAPSFRDFYGTTNNFDMWGGGTGTYEAMQGPCSTGYHIPSNEELKNLFKIFADLKGISSLFTETSYGYYAPYVSSGYYNNIYADFKTLLKIPQAGQYNAYAGSWSGGNTLVYGSYIYYNTYNYPSVLVASGNNFGANPGDTGYHFGILRPIRPFKNEAVQPDASRTKLY